MSRRKLGTFSHRIVLLVVINAIGWVWCSYLLAALGRVEIAQDLSREAVKTILGTVLIYAAKALFEKSDKFGAVGKPAAPETEQIVDL